MLIITNGLTNQADEGFLKVANQLIKRIKKVDPDTVIASYERQSEISNRHFKLNKLFLNPKFLSFVIKHSDVLYIPFPAKVLPTALRIFILSRFVKKRLKVILVMKNYWSRIAGILLFLSGAEVIVLSQEAENLYGKILPKERVRMIKIGVDTQRFLPVSREEERRLKNKYGFEEDKPVILHVGHLKEGRNIRELKKIALDYQVVLVTSTLTSKEQDKELREELLHCSNIHILDEFFPAIEEIYQMSDLYFFPTMKDGNCIDAPLSCLEAASCNKPVLTTSFGEMKELIGKPGFYHYKQMNEDELNRRIANILSQPETGSRSTVLAYDWNQGVKALLNIK